MRELWVFGHYNHAELAGFRNGRHLTDTESTMFAWNPSMGVSALAGLRFNKVVITESFRYNRDSHKWLEEIRLRARYPNMIWIEL